MIRNAIILLICIFPLTSQADIGHIPEDTSDLKEVIVTGNTIQELGKRLSGTGTKLTFYVSTSNTYMKSMHVYIVACLNNDDSPKYSTNCERTLIGEHVKNNIASPYFEEKEYTFNYKFEPEKHYFLLLDHFGGGRGVFIGGFEENIYPHGACHYQGRESDCVVRGGGGAETVADFAFSIEGVEVLPVVLPENPPTDTPTIFLPGIFGSRLYHGEEKVWDGFAGEKMRKLELDTKGNSLNEITVGETLFTFSALGINRDVYGPLKDFFNCSGTFSSSFIRKIPGNDDVSCGAPLISYAYDWRYDVFDILDKGTNYISGENVKLVDLVEHLSNNPTGKVHIVAHSNGGLLAKALMIQLEEQGKENLIENIVLVGSPQLGTPSAVGAMLHGHDQQLGFGFVKRKDVSRSLSQNSPGAYSLLPSPLFIENNKPIIEFDSSPLSNKYRNAFGEAIDSYGEFFTFLTDPTNLRITPEEGDLNTPGVLNEKLLEKAKDTHARIDNWSPPEGVTFTQIIGVGNQTVSKYKYSTGVEFELIGIGSLTPKPRQKLWYRPVTTEGGDSVVLAQASESSVGSIYYFDLSTLELESNRKIEHDSLLTEREILETIKKRTEGAKPTSAYASEEASFNTEEKVPIFNVISLYSPVIISVTDTSGNITKIEYDSDSDLFKITENIPDSFIKFIGEAKYVFLPEGNYDIEMTGIDIGSFDLVFSKTNTKGEIIEVERFENIPIKELSVATTSLQEDSFEDLLVDIDSDDIHDHTFSIDKDSDTLLYELKDKMINLEIRPQLKSAIEQYFELLENTNNLEEKANYVAQIKRIISFLRERYITKDTASTWSALAEHLQ